ncbi:ATP-grasp domain-containing protein, partial [candidate division WOR-3 bacterium]|nr:ATP-grasp domain-containing protein [candidate division WOR-3 bacterium]
MRLLVVGSGGRENAIAWQLARHGHRLWCAPGNPGTAGIATNVALDALDIPGLAALAERESVDLTVVGPEAPLVAGIADDFGKRGLAVFGPSARAARLEGDKAFAKELMRESGIPTARFENHDDHDRARSALDRFELPVVIKASGLAAGKGAVVCPNRAAAEACLKEMMIDGRFGEAGATVVIEE